MTVGGWGSATYTPDAQPTEHRSLPPLVAMSTAAAEDERNATEWRDMQRMQREKEMQAKVREEEEEAMYQFHTEADDDAGVPPMQVRAAFESSCSGRECYAPLMSNGCNRAPAACQPPHSSLSLTPFFLLSVGFRRWPLSA